MALFRQKETDENSMKKSGKSKIFRFTIKIKLLSSFMFLCVIIGVISFAGWYAINEISKEVSVFSEIAAPMNQASGQLIGNVRASVDTADLYLSSKTEDEIVANNARLNVYSDDFNGTGEALNALLKQGGLTQTFSLAFEARERFQLQSQEVALAQKAYLTLLTAEQNGYASINIAIDNQIKQLSAIGSYAESLMNKIEELSRTSRMAGDATMEKLGEFLDTTYNDYFPIVSNVAKLSGYMVKIQADIENFLNETNGVQLESFGKKIAKSIKTYESRQKRLKRRMTDDDAKAMFAELTENFNVLKLSIVGETGIMRDHQAVVAAANAVQDSRGLLVEKGQLCIKEVDVIVATAEQLNSGSKESAGFVITKALSFFALIPFIGVGIAIIMALLIIRSILSPVQKMNDMLKDIAYG